MLWLRLRILGLFSLSRAFITSRFKKFHVATLPSLAVRKVDGFVEVEGLRVYYTDFDPGASANRLKRLLSFRSIVNSQWFFPSSDAIVLIHGFAGNTESWSEVAPALARRLNRRVVAFDRPVSLFL